MFGTTTIAVAVRDDRRRRRRCRLSGRADIHLDRDRYDTTQVGITASRAMLRSRSAPGR
jgi:hypothetical protein